MAFKLIIGEKKEVKRGVVNISRLASSAGYTKSHISRVLKGESNASLACMEKLAEIMGESIDDLYHNIKKGTYASTNRR